MKIDIILIYSAHSSFAKENPVLANIRIRSQMLTVVNYLSRHNKFGIITSQQRYFTPFNPSPQPHPQSESKTHNYDTAKMVAAHKGR